MDVDYSGLERNRPDLLASAHEASRLLEAQMGPSASTIRARWGVGEDDRGRPFIDLEISDWTGSVGYRFAPDELSNAEHMELRLHRLWGDLLMVQSHVQMDNIRWRYSTQEGS